jgi:hypothetical protein
VFSKMRINGIPPIFRTSKSGREKRLRQKTLNFQPQAESPRGRSVSHDALPLVYHREVTQLALNFEDGTGGAAPWTTSLDSAA